MEFVQNILMLILMFVITSIAVWAMTYGFMYIAECVSEDMRISRDYGDGQEKDLDVPPVDTNE